MKTKCGHRIGTNVKIEGLSKMIEHTRACECGGCTGFRVPAQKNLEIDEDMVCCRPENHPEQERELQAA